MDTRRVILYALLGFVIFNLWSTWQHDYPIVPPATITTTTSPSGNNLLPSINEEIHQPASTPVTPSSATNQRLVHIKTDVLSVVIDTLNGDVIEAKLLNYPISTADKKPFDLLYSTPQKRFVANSSLVINSSTGVKDLPINYVADKYNYELNPENDQLIVTLNGQDSDGLLVKKSFIFTKNSYLIRINYDLMNKSNENWRGYMNMQLLQHSPEEDNSSMFHVGSYTGASYSNPGKHKYQKVSYKDMTKSNLNTDVTGGWIAMQQHYFLSAWIPNSTNKNVVYSRNNDDTYIIGAVSHPLTVDTGKTSSIGANLYLGPENTTVLKNIAPGLDLTVDYGWLWFLSSALFSLLKTIHSFVGNWGWSIVLVTVLIKLAFYRLSATSYKSMAGMRKLQPKLQSLKERYGDDKAKISQATMELYRQEKVNPLGGCLPILIQIPVFIALYWVLLESVELRQAPFIFWLHDLAVADPYHVLPIIMGGTMLIQQRLNPAPPDPMQAKIMMFLPVLFTGLFWNFPAGLVLYWIVNNTLSIIQQWYITHKYGEEKSNTKKKSLLVAK